MGDVCQPFYYDALGLERVASKRRALRVSFSFAICGQIKVIAKELHFQNPNGCFHRFGCLLQKQNIALMASHHLKIWIDLKLFILGMYSCSIKHDLCFLHSVLLLFFNMLNLWLPECFHNSGTVKFHKKSVSNACQIF